MRLISHTIDNPLVTPHTARAGDLFAEASLFGDRYHCDAVAAVDSRVHIYPKRVLLAAFRSDSALGERFMAVLAHQIRALRSRLEERNIRSARERV
jgi:CRP-like cAMP-binding protein